MDRGHLTEGHKVLHGTIILMIVLTGSSVLAIAWGFKVSSGTFEWSGSSNGTGFDKSEIASHVEGILFLKHKPLKQGRSMRPCLKGSIVRSMGPYGT